VFKTKRRLVVLGAAVLAAAALVIVLVAGWAGSGPRDVTDVDGNASAVL